MSAPPDKTEPEPRGGGTLGSCLQSCRKLRKDLSVSVYAEVRRVNPELRRATEELVLPLPHRPHSSKAGSTRKRLTAHEHAPSQCHAVPAARVPAVTSCAQKQEIRPSQRTLPDSWWQFPQSAEAAALSLRQIALTLETRRTQWRAENGSGSPVMAARVATDEAIGSAFR